MTTTVLMQRTPQVDWQRPHFERRRRHHLYTVLGLRLAVYFGRAGVMNDLALPWSGLKMVQQLCDTIPLHCFTSLSISARLFVSFGCCNLPYSPESTSSLLRILACNESRRSSSEARLVQPGLSAAGVPSGLCRQKARISHRLRRSSMHRRTRTFCRMDVRTWTFDSYSRRHVLTLLLERARCLRHVPIRNAKHSGPRHDILRQSIPTLQPGSALPSALGCSEPT